MKKALSLILALVMCLSLCACGGLTKEQKAACEEADAVLQKLCDSDVMQQLYKLSYKSETKTVEGKTLYIATITFDKISTTMAKAFGETIMPDLQEVLNKEDIYVGIYLYEGDEAVYKLIDDNLDSNFLEKI